jgi:protein-S-isoprenylcysteine O-methyltransferase Ste14
LAAIIDIQVIKHLGLKKLICVTELKQKKEKSNLITSGIYKYSRHPRYVEYPLWFLGLGLILRYWFLILFSVYIFIGLWAASYFEEKELIKRFGNSYIEYRKKVPRFFIK